MEILPAHATKRQTVKRPFPTRRGVAAKLARRELRIRSLEDQLDRERALLLKEVGSLLERPA